VTKILRAHVLFKYPDFLLYFLGRFISAVGDKVFTIAMSVWVVSENSASAKIHLGFLLAANTIPVVVLGPFAGAIADRFNRKICLLIADIVRFSVLFIALIMLINNMLTIAAMYVVCLLLASFVPLFESAAGASITYLVDEKDVSKAVALDGSVINISEIIGASLGGILVALFHFEGALLFNALTFLLSFICIIFIKKRLVPEIREKKHYLKEIREGFLFIKSNRTIYLLFTVFALVNFFTAPVFVLIPLLVKFKFHISLAKWVASYETSLALGAGIVAIMLSFVHGFKKVHLVISISLLFFGIGYILTGISSVPFLVCLWLFISGSSLAFINIHAITLFQSLVPDAMKGRFFSLLTTVCFAAIPLAYIVTGIVSKYIAPDTLFLINGIMISIIGLGLFFTAKFILKTIQSLSL
jgi:DHA3 family macrolide efflux protein-like MFS transporter